MKYTVNHLELEYQAEGPTCKGPDKVLLDNAIDLTARTSWSDRGYSIEPLFDATTFGHFCHQTQKLLQDLWSQAGMPESGQFPLNQYHQFANTQARHLAAVELTKLISVARFPAEIKTLESRISEICQEELRVKNPWDGASNFHFRIIRPKQTDNNPLHRDVWLEDYANCINLYIPIAGSNERSSLIIYPGSHHWPESRVERTKNGALINGIKFNVPAVTAIDGDPQPMRPNPAPNQVLVFSPYLVHGGSINLNEDSTRISIEVRLWRV